jgi:hypothetical protein
MTAAIDLRDPEPRSDAVASDAAKTRPQHESRQEKAQPAALRHHAQPDTRRSDLVRLQAESEQVRQGL